MDHILWKETGWLAIGGEERKRVEQGGGWEQGKLDQGGWQWGEWQESALASGGEGGGG